MENNIQDPEKTLQNSKPSQNIQEEDQDQIINPYQVVNTTGKEIDYDKLIKKFGCQKISTELLAQIQRITNKPPHHWLQREIFFSHRDLKQVLDNYEKGKPFYLYTGRGPSSDAMHLGHLMPFIFTKYLQDAFQVPLVIMMSDDEKYFHQKIDEKPKDLSYFTKMAYENIKDILAVGFNPENTFVFVNSEYMQHLYPAVARFQKYVTYNQLKGIFGVQEADCSGKYAYPGIQAAPTMSSVFPHIFDPKIKYQCLIPQGIDQDPYFRMTRDVMDRLKMPKPACIHSKFFPALQGFGTKMSSSDPNSSIFLTDTPNQITNKIKKYAFSGAPKTLEELQANGCDLSVDIPYNYLRFFLEDQVKLNEIEVEYGAGRMKTSDVKDLISKEIIKIVTNHQENRKKITDQDVLKFMEIRKINPFPQKKQEETQKEGL